MNYTIDEIRGELKPLSKNKFLAVFQKLYRSWINKWNSFDNKHPKLAGLLSKFFFFYIFCLSVTVWQYLIMLFLPNAFKSLTGSPWGWPGIPLSFAGDEKYIIFGDNNGLGYFISFEIATFTAQCINFPLQRNITYKSHGNPWYQAMWYFIGWVLISIFTSAIWGLCNCLLTYWEVNAAITALLKTVLTGGVSMVIFFFVFMIIFPDYAKEFERIEKKYNASTQEEKVKLQAKYDLAKKNATVFTLEKKYNKCVSNVNNKVIRFLAQNLSDEELLKSDLYQDTIASIEEKAAIKEKLNAIKGSN